MIDCTVVLSYVDRFVVGCDPLTSLFLYLITDWGLPRGVARATCIWSYQITGIKRDRSVANLAFLSLVSLQCPSRPKGLLKCFRQFPTSLLTFLACHLVQVGGETPASQNTTNLPTTSLYFAFVACAVYRMY